MNEIHWRENKKIDSDLVKDFSKSLNNLDITLSEILYHRGINSFDKAKDFFRPSLSHIHDPFLMKDMDLAVNRLEDAISKNQKILIYGDYDVDGTTAVSLVYSFLINHYRNISYYIPDRYAEGYGVSFQGIDYAADNGYALIIALDCGIKAIDKVAYANKKGVDFIICDHHRPGDKLPEAIAVLDPKRKDCNYPFKELSGCGVGFKLVQAYSIKNNIPFTELEKLFDLLAVSIAADIVPITGENRVLTHFGLIKINSSPRPGIQAMIQSSQINKKELTITDVVFTIAPRINAAGRIESGLRAVDLLITDSIVDAERVCVGINENNTDRKELDKLITEEALNQIKSNPELIKKRSTVLFSENWHKGVIGIVASRLIENYYKPTIVLTESNGKASGSARSVKGFDVYNAIDACSEHLEQFGGHMYAAGLTMQVEKIESFTAAFEKYVSSHITEDQLRPEIEIDGILELNQINDSFYKILKQFAPFGPLNMRPIFISKGVKVSGISRIVGENHLKVTLTDKDESVKFDSIGFKMAHFIEDISHSTFDVAYVIEENEWRGKKSIQLVLKDIKILANS